MLLSQWGRLLWKKIWSCCIVSWRHWSPWWNALRWTGWPYWLVEGSLHFKTSLGLKYDLKLKVVLNGRVFILGIMTAGLKMEWILKWRSSLKSQGPLVVTGKFNCCSLDGPIESLLKANYSMPCLTFRNANTVKSHCLPISELKPLLDNTKLEFSMFSGLRSKDHLTVKTSLHTVPWVVLIRGSTVHCRCIESFPL